MDGVVNVDDRDEGRSGEEQAECRVILSVSCILLTKIEYFS